MTGSSPASETEQQLIRAESSTPESANRSHEAVVNCWKALEWSADNFRFALDRSERTSGEVSASILSLGESSSIGRIAQTSDATPLKGKRVELSADLRVKGAKRGAVLSIRADDAQGRLIGIETLYLGYDADHAEHGAGMKRGPMGDIDWSTAQVLLDVPDQARTVTYGVSLAGSGQLWVDNVRLEVIAQRISADAGVVINPFGIKAERSELTSSPRNLDFEMNAGEPCS